MDGGKTASIKVLNLVPEAKGAVVFDVTIAPGRWIAVAADFSKGVGPASGSLLFFDLHGRLSSAFALAAERFPVRITADYQGNLWTMTSMSAGLDPAQVPLIVEYDAAGEVLHTYLTRDAFPAHAKILAQSTKGQAGMGFKDGVVWLWLPNPGDLVTIDVKSGAVARIKTGTPDVAHPSFQSFPIYDPKQEALYLRVVHRESPPNWDSVLYQWRQSTLTWTPVSLPSECPGKQFTLAGGDTSGEVLISHKLQKFCLANVLAPQQPLAANGSHLPSNFS